jgi:hypothetical protein
MHAMNGNFVTFNKKHVKQKKKGEIRYFWFSLAAMSLHQHRKKGVKDIFNG